MKMLPKVYRPWCPLRITWFVLLSVTLLAAAAPAAVGPGIASNFGVDGNLLSRSPSGVPYGTTDDWVPGANAASTAVLNNAGVPIDALRTFHTVDGTGGSDLSIFGSGSQKVSDNPNGYTWSTGSVPQKDDINNALFHTRTDGNGDIWLIVAADRRSTNGDSYIDFELLQRVLTKNADGTFTSLGLNGGRTVGDLLMTIELTRGGSQADFKLQRWESDAGAPSGFKYHDFVPPAGDAYVAANIDSAVWVPYGAFGNTTYPINGFGEAALNVTHLLASLDPCIDIPVLFIRTKSSDSPSAELKDFVDPIPLQLHLGAVADAGPDKVLTCDSTQLTLDGSSPTPAATYGWVATNGGHIVSGATTLTPRIDAAGTYILTVTNAAGCQDSDTALVTQNVVKPILGCTGDLLTCDSLLATASVTSNPSVGVSYLWTPAPVSGQGTAFARYNAPGNKKVVVTILATGCKDSCEAVITQSITKPVLSCSGDAVSCDSLLATASVASNPSVGVSYLWTPAPVSGQGTAFARYNASGTKKVVVTITATGCKDSCNAVIVPDFTKPVLSCAGDSLSCDSLLATASVTSNPSVGASYIWTPAPVSGQGTAFARYNAPGTKKVVVTLSGTGCKDSCEAVITQSITPPNADAGPDKVLTCVVTQINLSGSSSTPGAAFSWAASNGGHIVSGAATATPLVDAAGTYTLTVTNPANGCTATDVALVTSDVTRPNADAGPDKILTCVVTQISLSGSSSTPGAVFSWAASGGGHIVSGAATATPLVDAAGTYTLTVTNPANGCTATDVALVTSDLAPPNANAGPDKVLTCTVTQVNLSGTSSTPGATFSWVASGGGHIVSGATTATPLVDAAGTYTLTVTNPVNGCTATDVALVTSDLAPPNANAGPDKILTCTTPQLNLSGSSSTPGATFSWVASAGGHIVSGAATATPLVDAGGTYALTVTNPANGCTAKDTALVTSNVTPPNANAGPNKELTCDHTQVNLSGSSSTPGATFSWLASNGGHIVSGAGTATPLVDAAGTYELTVTNPSNGCTAKDTALVVLDVAPPNANAGPDKVLTCLVTDINLSGSSNTPGATFSWVASAGGHIVSGATTPTPLVDAAGTYVLRVTDVTNGCISMDTALVTSDVAKPNVDAGPDKQLTCAVTQLNLSGSSTTPGATFYWLATLGGHIVSGALTATPLVDAPGTYLLTVTNPVNGCTAEDIAVVTQNIRQPELSCDADTITCGHPQATAWVTSSPSVGVSYLWDPAPLSGQGTSQAQYNTPGPKSVIVTILATGCKDTCTVNVQQNLTMPELTCTGDDLTCDSTEASASVSFDFGRSKIPFPLTFFWSPAPVSGQGTPFARYSTPGIKKVVVTYVPSGCKDSCEAVITQNIRQPELSCDADTITCGRPLVTAWVTSSPSVGVSYLWNPAPLSGQGTSQAQYNTPGPKSVIVTILATGCKDTCTVNVQQNLTMPELTCTGDELTCDSTEASASVAFEFGQAKIPFPLTFFWSPAPVSGQGTPYARYNTPGAKKVVVTYVPTGCKDSCEAVITQNIRQPELSCDADTITCGHPQATAWVTSSPSVGVSYLWDPAPLSGQGTSQAQYNTPGPKSVIVTILATGCKDTCTVNVQQNLTMPELTCTGDDLTCDSTEASASVSFDFGRSKIPFPLTFFWTPAPLSGQGTPYARYSTPGIKKVVVTYVPSGCKDSCEATITQHTTRPELSCDGDTLTCNQVVGTASVTSSITEGVSYTWDPLPLSGQGTPNALYNTPGTKTVEVTILATGCKNSCNAVIDQNITRPVLSCAGDELTCDSLLATASVTSNPSVGVSFMWIPAPVSGQGTAFARYDTPGSKKVVVTILATGCRDSCEATITQNIRQPELSCDADTITCGRLMATAWVTSSPNAGVSYLWDPAPLSGQGTSHAQYNTPGAKRVIVTILATGCADTCTVDVQQNMIMPRLTCTGDALTCDSTEATAAVSFDFDPSKIPFPLTFFWTPAPVSGQGTPYARYNTPGTKKVVVTYVPSGCRDSCEATITQDVFKPSLTCTGDELTCDSTMASATVSVGVPGSKSMNGLSYLWTPAPVSGQGTPFARYDTPGNKKVVVTYLATGCKDSCEATITQNIWTPVLICTGDDLTCDSTLATASVLLPTDSKTSNGFSYLWTPAPVSGQGTPFARYSTPGTKKVVVTYLATGCKDSCEAAIIQDIYKPSLMCTGDELTCDSLLASATVAWVDASAKTTSSVSYLWTPAPVSGQGTPWARYDTPGTKKVVVTYLRTGCKDSCEAVITQSASLPNANAGVDKVLTCTVTQINLSGSSSTPNVTFSWVASAGGHIVSGGSTATPLVDQPGTYTLTVTNATNGCKATDVALVTRNNTAPNANAGVDKVLTCTATQINLSGSSSTGGATFSWVASGGGHIVSGGSTATPLVDQPGTYTLTVTNPANGCTATDVALVTRNNTAPNADAGVDKLLTCTVSQINLSGSSSTGGATFSWVASGGGHIVSGGSTATPLVDAAGTYTLTVTNPANGCTATDVTLVTRNATAPNANAGPDKVLNCSVTQINLSGSSSTVGVTFSWVASGGGHIVSGGSTATPLVDAAGTYTLTVTNPANGCIATDAAVVTRDVTPPNANAGPDKALSCTLTQINLSGSSSTPSATFNWAASDGGHIVSGGTTATPLVDQPGTYTLTVSNPGNGCTATDVALVTGTPNHAPVCVVPRDTTITTQVVPVQICLPVSGTDVDGDVVTCEKTSGAGTLSAGQWCFTWSSPKDTSVLVGIRCRDACDSCSSSFRVTILYRSLIDPCAGNVAPVCKLPRDTTILQCIPTIVSLPVSATDVNGNFKKCQIVSGPGTISLKGNWVYTPYGPETVHVTIRCVDSCNAYCEGLFTVSFVADNLKPVCKPVLDTTIHACPSVPIMIPLYTSAVGLVDCYMVDGPGDLLDGFWVYTPVVAGDVRATARCRSVCGNTWQWSLTVRVRLDGTNCEGAAVTVTPSPTDSPSATAGVSRTDPCACPPPGDIDEDGDVSVSDLAILTEVVYGRVPPASLGTACPPLTQCDVNCDGVVDRKDVEALAGYMFSQSASLCDPCKNRKR